MMHALKNLLIFGILTLLFHGRAMGLCIRLEPVTPEPKDVFWEKIEPSPYTMVIKTKKSGDFNFTHNADKDLEKYKILCKSAGIREEITENVRLSYPKKGFVDIKCAHPPISARARLKRWQKDIWIELQTEDFFLRVVLDKEGKDKPLMAERVTKYSIEVPAVAFVNEKNEIIEIISPPKEKIFAVNIDAEKIAEYNNDNPDLLNELEKRHIILDKRDEIIQKIVANAIYHPLGKFCLVKKDGRTLLMAEVLEQRVFLPLDCLSIPLNTLIQDRCISRFFPRHRKSGISDKNIIDLIEKRTNNYGPVGYISIDEFPLRKDWYVVTTPNTCYWTDYFTRYIEMQYKKEDVKLNIPIHLHPWHQIQWLLNTEEKYWIDEYQIYLIPSNKDIEFFKSRFPGNGLFLITGKDPYSDELIWGVYDDISLLQKESQELDLAGRDKDSIKAGLNRIKNSRGVMQRYYEKKDKDLVVNKEIDLLLTLYKRQGKLLEKIDSYKKDYPWRLLNTSFFKPFINEELAKTGWTVVNKQGTPIGMDAKTREFFYKEGDIARMDVFLFIIFELCYIRADNLSEGMNREDHLVGTLKGVCGQIDYLCSKYQHLKEFAAHLEYIGNVMRLIIWEAEKRRLLAKEQVNNGRYYLDKYNLGYYDSDLKNEIKIISVRTIRDSEDQPAVFDVEEMIKGLSKKQDIRNIEEFTMAFEKKLMREVIKVEGKGN